MAPEQNRAHPRYAIEVNAEIDLGDEKIPARTRNVSRGGLSFEADRALPLGTEFSVRLALVFDQNTFSEPIQLRGRVVWCTPLADTRHQVGTTFVGMTNEMRQYLEMFLRYLKEGLDRIKESEEE